MFARIKALAVAVAARIRRRGWVDVKVTDPPPPGVDRDASTVRPGRAKPGTLSTEGGTDDGASEDGDERDRRRDES